MKLVFFIKPLIILLLIIILGFLAVGMKVLTPNLAPLINDTIDNLGWYRSNNLNFIISLTAGDGSRQVVAFDKDPANAARLLVQKRLANPAPTLDDLKTILRNYLLTNDFSYQPQDNKVNSLDAGWIMNWLP